MLTNEEFRETVKHLMGDDLFLRVAALENLRDDPSADERMLPYLERLLEDKTPCLVAIPFLYAEIRWLAAHALAAERAALGINQPVQLQNVVGPIYTGDIIAAEQLANINGQGGLEGVLESFAIVRDMGYLPRIDLDLWPFDEYAHPTTTEMISVNGTQQMSRQPELVPA